MKYYSFFKKSFENIKTILNSQALLSTDGGPDLAHGPYLLTPRLKSRTIDGFFF